MSLKSILEFNKPEKVKTNNVLLEIARKVVNSSPEPRYKIKLRDDVLAMKEKERLGFNFNRSVTASLKSRWDVVENATKDYLQEIFDMNDQIEEDGRKYENQLINLIVTRTTNLGLNSRIEQMAGLFMHMNFYCTVLKFKIQHLEPTRAFMFTCSDLMGFSRPSQIIDRFAALQHVFTELYVDYETRQNLLNHLTETLSEVKAETNHRNMLMHNQMAEMHSRIKHLQTESAQVERAIIDQMETSTGASLEIYKIKNAVYNIYITMMNYRGLEATHSDSFGQLEELEVRVSHTQAAIKMLQLEETRRQNKNKLRKKAERAEAAFGGDAFSDRSSESLSENRSHTGVNPKVSFTENINVSAIESGTQMGVKVVPKLSKKSNVLLSRTLPVGTAQELKQNLSLPPICGRDVGMVAGQKKTLKGDGTLLLLQLDTNSNENVERKPSLKLKTQHVAVPKNKGRSCVQGTGVSPALAPDVRLLSSGRQCSDRLHTQDVSKCQLHVTKHLHKDNGAGHKKNVNVVNPQSKIQKQSSDVGSGVKRELKYYIKKDINNPNISSNVAPDPATSESATIIDRLDENTEEIVNAPKERKSKSNNTTIRAKNDTRVGSKTRAHRSGNLRDVNAKRVQVLSETANRRNLRDGCLNILAKVKL